MIAKMECVRDCRRWCRKVSRASCKSSKTRKSETGAFKSQNELWPGNGHFPETLFFVYKKGQHVWMNEVSGEIAAPKTEWICKGTGSVLNVNEMKFAFDYGGEQAVFTKAELSSLH